MASFNGLILTQAGANLQDKIAVSRATLQFTRAAIGDGLWPSGLDPTGLTGLIGEKKSLAIQGLTDEGTGQHKISVLMDNAGLETGFMTRELGVFADDPDQGEILYQVTNADNPDYLPPSGGATHIEMALDLIVVTSSASSVTAVINEALVYASKKDVTAARDSFKGFELDGRHSAYEGDLDAINRNSLYAVQQGTAMHLPEDLPVNAGAFCQTMILPGDIGRTQLVWSVDDPEHAGWWRRRAAGVWSDWRQIGSGAGLPVGMPFLWLGATPPPGAIDIHDGPLLNRATWPELWEFAETSGNIITEAEWQAQAAVQSSVGSFSSGDGATTFRAPRWRDFGRAADPSNGRPVGMWQGDAIRNITGGSNNPSSNKNTVFTHGQSYTDGAFQYTHLSTIGGTGNNYGVGSFFFDASLVVPTADENRPKSINWLPCIQAASVPTDAGTVNMLQLASEMPNKANRSEVGSLQVVTAKTAASYFISSVIPYDDTIPQITEGTEVLSLTFTPKRAGSKVLVRGMAWISGGSTLNRVSGALFNGAADAFAAIELSHEGDAYVVNGTRAITGEFVTESLLPLTISFRVGVTNGASPVGVNKDYSNTERYGGANYITLEAMEIAQ